MTYETVATFSQVAALLIFIVLFTAVVAYTFWPGNKQRFDKAANSVLDSDPEQVNNGGGA